MRMLNGRDECNIGVQRSDVYRQLSRPLSECVQVDLQVSWSGIGVDSTSELMEMRLKERDAPA